MEGQPTAPGIPAGDIVNFMYQLVLRRSPDQPGLAYWTGLIESGTPLGQVFQALLASIEFRANVSDHPLLRQQPLPIARVDCWSHVSNLLPLRILDAGAQILSNEEHVYSALLRAFPCEVTGFEPLPGQREKRRAEEPRANLLPHFLGDGSTGTFHITKDDACSSLFEPNLALMSAYTSETADAINVVATRAASTTRLDDVGTTGTIDLFKLDVQGSELNILRGAPNTLSHTLVIHTEIAFDEVYVHQPLFADVDAFLRAADFELIDLVVLKRYQYVTQDDCGPTSSRLLWGDAVYLKRVDALAQTARDLAAAACIMHTNYDKRDLCGALLERYDRMLSTNLASDYAASIATAV